VWYDRSGSIEYRPTIPTLNEISSRHNDSLVMTNRRDRSRAGQIKTVGRNFNAFAAHVSVARSLT